MDWLLIIPEKPRFGHMLGPFWPKNLKTRFFPKNLLSSSLSLYATKTFCRKPEMFYASIFHKTWKTSFGPIVAPFGLKTSKQDFFQKIHPDQLWEFVLL